MSIRLNIFLCSAALLLHGHAEASVLGKLGKRIRVYSARKERAQKQTRDLKSAVERGSLWLKDRSAKVSLPSSGVSLVRALDAKKQELHELVATKSGIELVTISAQGTKTTTMTASPRHFEPESELRQ